MDESELILSAIPVFNGNDLIIPIVRDDTPALRDDGSYFTITAEALDRDFKSYENGWITIDHNKEKVPGLIAEVWREKPFVYGRITGLQDELRARILSKEYKGTSQESNAITVSADGKVTSLRGRGTSFIFSKSPLCPLKQGCGTIPPNFSLSTSQINSAYTNKLDGGTQPPNMTDYTPDQMTAMLSYMKANPDMITKGMKSMMKEISGTGTDMMKSAASPDPVDNKGAAQDELKVANDTIAALKVEIETLKKGTPELVKSAVSVALKEQVEQNKRDALMTSAKSDYLASTTDKKGAEEFLKLNPSLDIIVSATRQLKAIAPKAGASSGEGEQINSSKKDDEDQTKSAIDTLRQRAGLTRRRVNK